ncbi:hypothetical protein DICPUDRAFT_154838 [Dictyostelium purpureum]|uniref:Uncharacterized protein n=1 Tax=Dictyostelium purpureum TaxID=5786 RepID=F0ZSE4_DICPU|nr:uncharacterized protein DICPUDRAFT_154838 [Dictyostelium purpureum]EGC33137.1 hypothetical protein DICPUDRAFT_154838 [Dictyostelium purpureum]|eukprot:XP_003290332.1 hypothetical protein DICPUDRAFT_154838 [Dictyostelium purpureum]
MEKNNNTTDPVEINEDLDNTEKKENNKIDDEENSLDTENKNTGSNEPSEINTGDNNNHNDDSSNNTGETKENVFNTDVNIVAENNNPCDIDKNTSENINSENNSNNINNGTSNTNNIENKNNNIVNNNSNNSSPNNSSPNNSPNNIKIQQQIQQNEILKIQQQQRQQRSIKKNLKKRQEHETTGGLSLLKYGLTLPLDVIMTRLIVHRFYRRDSQHYINECTFTGVCRNEGIRGLYSGWETIVLKSLLDLIYSKLDDQLKSKRKQNVFNQSQQQQSEKSPSQIILMGVKILLDYILTVIKVRMNIRNVGLFKTLRNIVSREGLKGLFSGLNIYFLLFPLWMISILVSNIIFRKVKNTLNRSEIPNPSSTSSPKSSSDSVTYYDKDVADSGLGVAMVSDISTQVLEEDDDNEEDGHELQNHKIYK